MEESPLPAPSPLDHRETPVGTESGFTPELERHLRAFIDMLMFLPEMDSEGNTLALALGRGDKKKVLSVLRDLEKEAKEALSASDADYISYLREAVQEEIVDG